MPRSDAPIFLIGYRGTGKSSVARELAGLLDFDWVDVDDQIEATADKSIAAIFAEDGEPVFRDIESRVLARLCGIRRTVIALGGGTLGREENRELVKAAGPVIWLTASVDTIHGRLADDPTTPERRPNLTAAGGRREIELVLAERAPIYQACATFAVDTEGKSISEIAAEIAKLLAAP